MNTNRISRLPLKQAPEEISSDQLDLDLKVAKQTEIQGIGMGVLDDGTAFLHQRGLARLCGVENAHIGTISSQWNDTEVKPRIAKIKELLAERGLAFHSPHIEVKYRRSSSVTSMSGNSYINATRSHSPRIAERTRLATASDAYDAPPANKDDAALMARLFKAK